MGALGEPRSHQERSLLGHSSRRENALLALDFTLGMWRREAPLCAISAHRGVSAAGYSAATPTR